MKFRWITQPERQPVSGVLTTVYLEMSTRCNFSCTACPRHSAGDLKITVMTPSLFTKIVASLKAVDTLKRIVLMGYGEALCHPRILAHLEDLSTIGADIVLVTNGHLLTPAIADAAAALPLAEIVLSWDDVPGEEPAHRPDGEAAVLERAIAMIRESKERANSPAPVISIETVLRKSTIGRAESIIAFAKQAGAGRWYLSNLFPYDRTCAGDIAYVKEGPPPRDLKKALRKTWRGIEVILPSLTADTDRRCPFMERGSLFISVTGDVSPCMELAYTHDAVYFGIPRKHYSCIFGTMRDASLREIWEDQAFLRFRESFLYWDFPDCTSCYDPARCHNRMDLREDCYGNPVPCGECLWAKGIVVCP